MRALNLSCNDTHSRLRAVSERFGPAVIVSVGGEIDVTDENIFERLVTKMARTAGAPGLFVVDLTDISFIGRGALETLAREAKRCRRRGTRLVVVSCRPVIARIIAGAGLRPLLPIYSTVEAALSGSRRRNCWPVDREPIRG